MKKKNFNCKFCQSATSLIVLPINVNHSVRNVLEMYRSNQNGVKKNQWNFERVKCE